MNTLSFDDVRPYQLRNFTSIMPGPTGSVGEVNVTPRLRSSANDMPLRFDPYFAYKNASKAGSNVQNGTSYSYDSGGQGPVLYDSNWTNRRRKVRNGWIIQDIRAPDTLHQPTATGIPQYSWNNRISTVYDAFRTGYKFLPAPGYGPNMYGVPRGGMVPRIVDDEKQEEFSNLNQWNAEKQMYGERIQKPRDRDTFGEVTQGIVKRF